MPSVEDLLVPTLNVTHATIVMVAQDTPPLQLFQLLWVHFLPNLVELQQSFSLVLLSTMHIDPTGVEVVSNIDDEPCRTSTCNQLLLSFQHDIRHQSLCHAINLPVLVPFAIGHRYWLAWVTLRIPSANGADLPLSALVSCSPATQSTPITDREELAGCFIQAHARPLNPVQAISSGWLGGFGPRLELRAIKCAKEVVTAGVSIEGVWSGTRCAAHLLAVRVAGGAMASAQLCWTVTWPRRWHWCWGWARAWTWT
mmetsp:Transcript_43241/g.78688  ORF Transcript_43241/g.78688 Transcript_43241/m.78688 type:complete len:255 (+) Transcript_43241:844-1608(+)